MAQAQPYSPIAGALLKGYKLTLSPVFRTWGAECVSRHGAWAGLWMGAARLSRCRPGGSQGEDPAPTLTSSGARWFTPWRYGVWRVSRSGDARPS
jgi:putative component of membrane protein insertase Oxa1/YidC/SpoIIIJ protein YidD